MYQTIKIGLFIFVATMTLCVKPTIESPQILPPRVLSVAETKQIAFLYAGIYKVKYSHIDTIVSCESGWDTHARNLNEREDSHGLVQINLKAHKDITVKQAEDPNFSLDYLASNLSKGKGDMWSCNRLLKKV